MTSNQNMNRDTSGADLSAAEAALEARQLIRRAHTAALATRHSAKAPAGFEGVPLASFVTLACDCAGAPLILISRLAEHTRNLEADPRASLLIEAASQLPHPQEGPRVSVVGRLVRADDSFARRRFVLRHPRAEIYADFEDFAFYRMEPVWANYVGGFARAKRVTGAELLYDAAIAHEIAGIEQWVVDELNRDHPDVVQLLATRLSGGDASATWQAAAADPEGLDLMCDAGRVRLTFETPVHDGLSLRQTLSDLAARARAK